MIELKDVSKRYPLGKTEIQALKGVSLAVDRGEMISIMGPSGSGKSTLLNIIGCLDTADRGTVLIDGIDTGSLSLNQRADIRAEKIGFIFQSYNLIPVLNVYENIEFPLFIGNARLTKAEREKRILRLIEEVGLRDEARRKPDMLSGGQRQRVAIARALVCRPSIVLADEPTANLDSSTAHVILETMVAINREEKVTFVFATHDPNITRFASRVCRIKDGSFVAEAEGGGGA